MQISLAEQMQRLLLSLTVQNTEEITSKAVSAGRYSSRPERGTVVGPVHLKPVITRFHTEVLKAF